MAASLSMSFVILILTILTPSFSANHNNPLNYWKSSYPTIPIPSIISQHVPQMADNEINTLVSLIQNNALSSNLTYFCKKAALVCSHSELKANPIEGSGKCYGAYIGKSLSPESVKTISQGIFFRESVLKDGATFDMGDLAQDTSPAKSFLPYSIASLLTLKQSQVLFRDTDVRDMMTVTVSMCNSYIPQETRKCINSVKELVDFPAAIFGDRRLKMLNPKSNAGSQTTVLLKNTRPLLHENPKAKFVSCHELFFPYIVMYCHATSKVQVYEADLVHPETHEKMNDGMIAVCHRDTSYWDPKHVSFSALKVRPGETEICHWMSTANLAWVHLDDTLVG
ncbi:hypothetical protein ACHQM5_007191 [Ranunculus cassubicifolius]